MVEVQADQSAGRIAGAIHHAGREAVVDVAGILANQDASIVLPGNVGVDHADIVDRAGAIHPAKKADAVGVGPVDLEAGYHVSTAVESPAERNRA